MNAIQESHGRILCLARIPNFSVITMYYINTQWLPKNKEKRYLDKLKGT
jgi:hypothetical protein